MEDYKIKLCDTQVGRKKTVEKTHEPKTIDMVYKDIHNHKVGRKLNYRQRMEKNMQKSMYLMKDLHKQLCNYWQDFGFLSKSSSENFAKALLPSIRVYHHHNIDADDEGLSGDEMC